MAEILGCMAAKIAVHAPLMNTADKHSNKPFEGRQTVLLCR
jgi:hypothetical protein